MMLSGEAAVRWISKNEQISTVGTVVDSWFLSSRVWLFFRIHRAATRHVHS